MWEKIPEKIFEKFKKDIENVLTRTGKNNRDNLVSMERTQYDAGQKLKESIVTKVKLRNCYDEEKYRDYEGLNNTSTTAEHKKRGITHIHSMPCIYFMLILFICLNLCQYFNKK